MIAMISKPQDTDSLVSIASAILTHTAQLSQHLFQHSIAAPSLHVGASSDLWRIHSGKIEDLRSTILGLTQHLNKLLEGPHGFLHEYVSPSWEHGALYTLLEFDVLQKIPLEGGTSVPAVQLAEQSNLPAEKLLRICRLAATAGILEETTEGEFAHTAISQTLVKDEGFRSWVHFQYVFLGQALHGRSFPLALKAGLSACEYIYTDSPDCSRPESQARI
jgi:hypothetical protein